MFDRTYLQLHSERLLQNYRRLRQMMPKSGVLPMVKANGYGTSAQWVAQTLENQSGLEGFGVATLEEGLELRRSTQKPIVVFSGAQIQKSSLRDYWKVFDSSGLEPVLNTSETLRHFHKHAPRSLRFHLEWETGMGRLGLELSDRAWVERHLLGSQRREFLRSMLTHWGSADQPRHSRCVEQLRQTTELLEWVRAVFPEGPFHMANSASIWNRTTLKTHAITDWIRPGIALYGIPPFAHAQSAGIQPVSTWQVRVIHQKLQKRGSWVGYGVRRPIQTPIKTQLMLAGYGDGLPRQWSDQKLPTGLEFVGRISMDCATIRPITRSVGPLKSWTSIWDTQTDFWVLAQQAQTIPYHLMTGVGARVPRIIEGTSKRSTGDRRS